MSQLVSALYGINAGKPAIMLGGGPSVFKDLSKIPGWQDMLQISANGHGFKIPGATPRYIFTKDHEEVRRVGRRAGVKGPLMEPQMRRFGVPIISIQYWADYRCAKWPLQGNSGQHALGVLALMGSTPVIAVGMDCFQGATYFHTPFAANVSQGLLPQFWDVRFRRFHDRMQGALIRGTSGVVAKVFGRYSPTEKFATDGIPDVMRFYAHCPPRHVRILKPYVDSGKATEIPAGTVVAVTTDEANMLCQRGFAEACA